MFSATFCSVQSGVGSMAINGLQHVLGMQCPSITPPVYFEDVLLIFITAVGLGLFCLRTGRPIIKPFGSAPDT